MRRRSINFFLILSVLLGIAISGCASYQQAKRIDAEVKRIEQKLDAMLEKAGPITKEAATAIATRFADLKEVTAVRQPQVISSHTQTFNVMGNDGKGDILVGVHPATGEVIKMVKQCPYPDRDAENVVISEEEAIRKARGFLSGRGLPPIPEAFVLDKPRLRTTWRKKHWEVTWRHYVGEVEVVSDFVTFMVNAETGEIASYSKVRHDVEVLHRPKLSAEEAIRQARGVLGKGTLAHYDSTMSVLKTSLKILYPNRYFEDFVYHWSDRQALAWVVQFAEDKEPAIDVWIDALSGEVLGGEIYERPVPELWGCLDQTGDVTSYPGWEGALDLMQYSTSHTFLYSNNCPEANLINSIQNGTYFILQTHGDTVDNQNREYSCLTWSCDPSVDGDVLTPDEIPSNNLRYALMSHCMSGHDGPGDDFKDVFIDRGADVFQGYFPYINPDHYENALLRYLAEGSSLYNAHHNAVADVNPWFTIVIEYGPPLYCYNQLRLAPLLVDVSAPSSAWHTATILATIRNREDARHTTATNIKAELELPSGFTIVSGNNPQTIPALSWYHSWTAQWTVHAPLWTRRSRTFDIVVWSDNLGVAVDDFDDPYHKVTVNFGFPFRFVLKEYLELEKWWELADRIYADYPEPQEILSLTKEQDRYKSADDVQNDPVPFLQAMDRVAKLELSFGTHFLDSVRVPRETVNRYLEAVRAKMAHVQELQRAGIGDAREALTKLSEMQIRLNSCAVQAFWKRQT